MNTARGPLSKFPDMGTSALGHFPSFFVSAIIPDPGAAYGIGFRVDTSPPAGCCGGTFGSSCVNVSRANGMQAATAQTLAFPCLRG